MGITLLRNGGSMEGEKNRELRIGDAQVWTPTVNADPYLEHTRDMESHDCLLS